MKKLLFITMFAALLAVCCTENSPEDIANSDGNNTEQGDNNDSNEPSNLQEYIVGRWLLTRLEWRFEASYDGGVLHSENAPFAITGYEASASVPDNGSRADDYELDEGQVIYGYENRYMEFKADGTIHTEVYTEYLPEWADKEGQGYETAEEDMTYILSGDRIVMTDIEGYKFDCRVVRSKDEDGFDCMVLMYTSDAPTEEQPWTMENMYFRKL